MNQLTVARRARLGEMLTDRYDRLKGELRIADTYLRAVGKIAQLAPEARRFHLASFLMGRSSVEPACSSGLDCTGHERDFRVSAGGRQAHTLL